MYLHTTAGQFLQQGFEGNLGCLNQMEKHARLIQGSREGLHGNVSRKEGAAS